MMLGLSKLCICLGGKWNLKLKKKISSESVKWTRNDPISSDLSQRIILIYPTDQTIIIPTDFPFFFLLFGTPWQLKTQTLCTKQASGCSLQAEFCHAGWEPAAFHPSHRQGISANLPLPLIISQVSSVPIRTFEEQCLMFSSEVTVRKWRAFILSYLQKGGGWHMQNGVFSHSNTQKKRNLSVTSQEVVCYSWTSKKREY